MTLTDTLPGAGVRLSVNVDHVATLRQARGTVYPDPVEAAAVAEGAGAAGITVHLRGDRRHIQDADVERLRGTVRGKLNLEMAATEEMVALAVGWRPHQCTLVPERPEEVTTEGGLDLARLRRQLPGVCERLRDAGIEVSLFLDPAPDLLTELAPYEGGLLVGVELNTDAFTRATGGAAGSRRAELARAADIAASRGFRVYAGHGLTPTNVAPVASIPEVEELNIGHGLVARAVFLGLDGAVREMLAAIRQRPATD
ncbi:MAG: pyridoxine 5'-phosphate synthase [Thermoanaerobaculia bacterium]